MVKTKLQPKSFKLRDDTISKLKLLAHLYYYDNLTAVVRAAIDSEYISKFGTSEIKQNNN